MNGGHVQASNEGMDAAKGLRGRTHLHERVWRQQLKPDLSNFAQAILGHAFKCADKNYFQSLALQREDEFFRY